MKNIFFVLLLSLIISACGKDKEENSSKNNDKADTLEKDQDNEQDVYKNASYIIGKWVNKDSKAGFDIQPAGKIASINMATLNYNSWQLDGNKLTINLTNKGVSDSATTNEAYIVRRLTTKRLILSPVNDKKARLDYEKQ